MRKTLQKALLIEGILKICLIAQQENFTIALSDQSTKDILITKFKHKKAITKLK